MEIKNNKLRLEFEKINGYDVYAYFQDRSMYNPEVIGFCENYVEFLENKLLVKPNKLKHLLSGNIGVFQRETQPTGKPNTTVIKLDDGREYFAPSSEFIELL